MSLSVPKAFCFCAAAAALCLSPLGAQAPTDAVPKGEFPGLQLLPPGSVVEGISLPRYENHRVTSQVRAGVLKVLNRREVELKDIDVSMYAENGGVTHLHTEGATYDFTHLRAVTKGGTTVTDPRFSASGSGVVFNTEVRRGLLMGPVKTTISADAFKSQKKVTQPKK